MKYIDISVKCRTPYFDGDELCGGIVADNSDYAIRFRFDNEWDYGSKIVYLVDDNGMAYEPIITHGNIAVLPTFHIGANDPSSDGEISLNSKKIWVGVQQGEVKTSRPCSIRIIPSIKSMMGDEIHVDEENRAWMIQKIMDYQGRISQLEGKLSRAEEMLRNDIYSFYWKNEKTTIRKIAPYLCRMTCDNLDYEYASEYFDKYKPELGGCSVVVKDNLVGRNYDWYYNHAISVIMYTSASQGRHEVMGVAQTPSGITESSISNGKYDSQYRLIPFLLLDGINDKGLFCEINVTATGDYGTTIGTNVGKPDLFAAMIPRYVLDYASDIDEAIELLRNRNVFCADSDSMKQEFHFMLSQNGRSVEIEFINNEMVVIDSFVDNKPIATNFYLYGYNGTRNSLTPYAMGIERFAKLRSGYGGVDSVESMKNLMKSVWYTRAYSSNESPMWYSEFCGDYTDLGYGNLTKDSPTEDYEAILERVVEMFDERVRDGKTWQSVHTSVYDLSTRALLVIPQESGNEYRFYL